MSSLITSIYNKTPKTEKQKRFKKVFNVALNSLFTDDTGANINAF